MASKSQRVLALDILRGITIAGMLLVNNPGSWGQLYAPLEHAEWIGLTPTDLVFPFFVFVMGVSMYFSLKKYQFTLSGKLLWKIVRRTLILFCIGWAVGIFARFVYGLSGDKTVSEIVENLDTLRALGVFQRLALVYFVGSMTAVLLKHKFIPWLIVVILGAYALILGLGNGYEFSLDNIIAKIDLAVLGEKHLYTDTVGGVTLPIDPEGLLSTLPCVAHVLIGFMVGKMITETHTNADRISKLLIPGFVLMLCGWLLSYGIPVGKKMWSSTFVMITCGLAMSVLALLIHVVDVKGRKRWSRFFEAFGVNPLMLYLCGTVLAILFGAIPIGYDAEGAKITIHSVVYDGLGNVFSAKTASCLYAILFVCLNWVVGYVLYKKKIYVKI